MARRRIGYLALGSLAAAAAVAAAVWWRGGWWPVVVFAVAPDLTLLASFRPGLAKGQLDPRAVPLYNAVHRLWVPALVVLVGVLLRSPAWAGAGLAWVAHIGFDRALGFGLRQADGFQRVAPG